MQFKNILVHATPRSETDPAIAAAVALARRYHASVTLFDVAPDLSWPMQFLAGGWEQTIEDISGGKRKLLEQKAEALTAEGIVANYILAKGRLSIAIVRQVISDQHDLVIKVAEAVGANRSGFLGSTDFRLLRKCPSPVLVLKRDHELRFQHVAAALDVMDDHEIQKALDRRVLQAALAVCEGELQLVYTMRSVQEIIQIDEQDTDLITPDVLVQWHRELAELAEEKLETMKRESRCGSCRARVLPGSPTDAIPEFVKAEGIDLLVMGTLGRSGLDGMLIGNTAELILNHVECSVLALKPATFVSPLGKASHSNFAA